MIKRPVIYISAISIILAMIIAGIFLYRYQLIQYSAETLIRKNLPDYITVDTIKFDFKNSRVLITGSKVQNPPDFSNKYLLEIQDISCKYKLKGRNIVEGIAIFDPVFSRPLLNIERLEDGRLNLIQMKEVTQKSGPAVEGGKTAVKKEGESGTSKIPGNIKLSDLVKLPEVFKLRDGKVIFTDRMVRPGPHILTFENVESSVTLKLDSDYSKITSLASTGTGDVNGDRRETIQWDIALNPNTPRLTMSSRFEITNVAILTFEPYYDRYSPLIFQTGLFSGTLVFDFDNGNIGSMDEIRLSNFRFYVKPGYENAQFWDTTVPDLAKYFTSPYGEIVFDFRIKGDMPNPQFYLGPKSKAALTNLAIDKVSSAIQQMSDKSGANPKSDIEKAKQYIDMFKGLIKK